MKGRWIAAITSLSAATVAFGAAALAQVPSPTPQATSTPGVTTTTTPATTSTAGTTTTTPATTGTVTGTVGTPVGTGTSVVTGTVTTGGTPFPTIPVPTSIYVPGGQGGFRFADAAMQRLWNRTDKPVADGKVSRTWFWGPGPNTPGLLEPYAEAPTQARGLRLVQYYDKSRMEINNPQADATQPFFVTNGLLTVELISGFVQVGEKNFDKFHPACIPMSGDFGDTLAPTYFAFQGVSNTQAGDHNAPDRTGQNATDTIDRNGTVGTDPTKGSVTGVKFAHYENHHNIPAIFWNFLNSSGPVYDASGKAVNEQLIVPWFYASGLPISEPYWAKAKIRGTVTDVLIQAYERRALTYVPTNQGGFQVEMANIGQHYFDWRYRNIGACPGVVPGTPTPPVPAATGTSVPGTGTVVPGTPKATTTASPQTTTTAVSTALVTTTPSGSPTVGGTPQPIPVTPSVKPTSVTQTPVGTPIP